MHTHGQAVVKPPNSPFAKPVQNMVRRLYPYGIGDGKDMRLRIHLRGAFFGPLAFFLGFCLPLLLPWVPPWAESGLALVFPLALPSPLPAEADAGVRVRVRGG